MCYYLGNIIFVYSKMLINNLTSTDFFRKLNTKRTVQDDLTFGYANETQILNKLNSTFFDTFRNTKELYGEFCNYDFEGLTGNKIEMKSRRNKYRDFPTTIIPVHKCINQNSPNIFVFQFTDGIYYIAYDENKFNDYEMKTIVSNRADKNESKLHYFIPIDDLIQMQI